ncbi:PAP2 family protein [Candidatus Chloroploca sp. M-50]|uniref:PAP2 family protein n=1 Tax=Candidatus Chloroploca mongolica TaxID=2528176 RepID=A0ABS4DAA0_9CHLR|nr:PAP2 family protein [Candidatus Chloroploca mongolica]MBP1466355.1 PAP2 family protein [Candidatus Chloroploca mongolica]
MSLQHNDLSAEALRRGAMPGRGYIVARLISQVLHPVILGVVSIFIVGLLGISPLRTGLLWALLATFLQVVPPLIFFAMRLRQGVYTDDDISVRSQRNELYLFGIINLLVSLLILLFAGAPLPMLAMVTSALILSVIAWFINLYWKISVHASTMGSTATLASLYAEPLGLFFWLCALALGWARVRTRNHTVMQVVTGLALSALCVVGTFMAFGLL